MKKAKLLLLACLAGLMCLMLTGCGGGSAGGGDGKTIVFASHDDVSHGFTQAIYEAVKSRAESKGYTVEMVNANMDASLQIDQMNEELAKKPAAVVLLPVDATALVPAVQKANDMKIPVLVTNRDIAGGTTAQVQSDEYQAGKLQGEFMAKHLKQGAKIVYFFGDTTLVSANERWRGFKEACLDKRPDIELLASQDAKWNKSNALRYMTLWLKIFPEIDGVACGNDDMALGAIAAMKAAGRFNGVYTTGVDAGDEAVKSVAAGELSQTIKQDPDALADKIVEELEQMISGGQNENNDKVPFIEITRDNVAQFMK